MPAWPEVVGHGAVGREEMLRMPGGCAPLHVVLALPRRTMGVPHRLFRERRWRCATPGRIFRLAVPSLFTVSVMTTRGTYCKALSSLRKTFCAACVLRRLCTSMSSTFSS